MRHALHAILGMGLSVAAFSGVLLFRQLFDLSSVIFPIQAGGYVFDYSVCAFGLFVSVLVAGTAAAGLIAGRRWVPPEDSACSRRAQTGRWVALTIPGTQDYPPVRGWPGR